MEMREPARRKKQLSLVKVSLNPFRKSVYGKRFAERKVLGGEKEKEKMKKMRNKTRKMIVALAVGLLLSMVLSVGMVVANANTLVTGIVTNEDTGEYLKDATVNAICNGSTAEPNSTSDAGRYELLLPSTVCKAGDTVDVVATYGGHTGSGSGIVEDSDFLGINIAIVCVEIPIPEFATIAMPVAAILGLVLFFNHRKHKKE